MKLLWKALVCHKSSHNTIRRTAVSDAVAFGRPSSMWHGRETGLGGQRVAQGKFVIEHVMPRKSTTHWQHLDGPQGKTIRDALIDLLCSESLVNIIIEIWSAPSGPPIQIV